MDAKLKEKIKVLTDRILPHVNNKPIGLFDGQMGLCIYLYKMGKVYNDPNYERVADEILDSICKKINDKLPLNLENGIAGIGMGVYYLLNNSFIEGNTNEVLENFDIPIFKAVEFQRAEIPLNVKAKMDILYYCINRYKEQQEESDSEYLFRHAIFKILNSFRFTMSDIRDPYNFSLDFLLPLQLKNLGSLIQFDKFKQKIYHLAEENTHEITSCWPALHSHRLYLLWGMYSLTQALEIPEWHEHIIALRKSVDVQQIIEKEISHNQIFMKSGLTGIWLILSQYNNFAIDTDKFSYSNEFILNKIFTSNTWHKLLHDEDYFKSTISMKGICSLILQIFDIFENEK